MTEYGGAVSKGVGGPSGQPDFGTSINVAVDQAVAAIDNAIHLVVPAAVPSWLVVGIFVLAVLYFAFRR